MSTVKTAKKTEAKKSKIAKVFLSKAESEKMKAKIKSGDIRVKKVYSKVNNPLPKYYKRTTDTVNKFDTMIDYFNRVGVTANTEHDFSGEEHEGGLSPLDKSNMKRAFPKEMSGLKIEVVEHALIINPKKRAESVKKGLGGKSKKFRIFRIVRK